MSELIAFCVLLPLYLMYWTARAVLAVLIAAVYIPILFWRDKKAGRFG